MPRIDANLLEIRSLDSLSRQSTVIHRIDPRALIVTTMVFVVSVMSVPRYEISALVPYFLYPILVVSLAALPMGDLLQKMALAAPFALFVGIFNPLLDREPVMAIGKMGISGGWVSFASIMIRFTLTVGAALILTSVAGMYRICMGLERLGVPRLLSVQLLFLHRYIFVLLEEAIRMMRAKALRTFDARRTTLSQFGHLVGSLLLRTLDRADRIHRAMVSRGFDGEIRLMSRLRLRFGDVVFVSTWSSFFILSRIYNLPRLLGQVVSGVY